jgi:hypothetical protein
MITSFPCRNSLWILENDEEAKTALTGHTQLGKIYCHGSRPPSEERDNGVRTIMVAASLVLLGVITGYLIKRYPSLSLC